MTTQQLLSALRKKGTAKNRAGMARYGIVAKKVFGVSVKEVQLLAKTAGRDHALAQSLWKSGWFEARLLAAFVDDPKVISAAEMERWARSFENWADCDTAVMHLFDRTPHAWTLTRKWCSAKPEFVKRAGFAMLASMALHHKSEKPATFIKVLPWIARGADDERNFVKKAVNWALRSIGSRDPNCHAAAVALATKLAAREEPAPRWIGKDALRQLATPATMKRVARAVVALALVALTAGARIVNGRGKWLIPGLWDMHVHTVMPGGRTVLPLYIANGVTGVRDMAGDLDTLRAWRAEIARGSLVGPRLVVSGPYLEGGDQPIPHLLARTPEEGRAGVDSLVALGVDFVKVHGQLSPETYYAIARRARERGIRFAGHVSRLVGAASASDSGQRSIEHLLAVPLPWPPPRWRVGRDAWCRAIRSRDDSNRARPCAAPAWGCSPAPTRRCATSRPASDCTRSSRSWCAAG